MLKSIKSILIGLLLFSNFAHSAELNVVTETNRSDLNKPVPSEVFFKVAGKDVFSSVKTDQFDLHYASHLYLAGIDNRDLSIYSGLEWSNDSQIGTFLEAYAANQFNPGGVNVSSPASESISVATLVPVPLPAAAWSMVTALIGLLYLGRRKL